MPEMPAVLAVIGDPIAHSLSPVLHGFFIDKYDLPFCYHAFRVPPAALPAAVAGAKALGLKGLNVTVPHKQAVIPLLDELDPLAREIGAVNTIVFEQGKAIGYNTDAPGFLGNLAEKKISLDGKAIAILGAGGAARAVAFAAKSAGAATLHLWNRSEIRATELAAVVGGKIIDLRQIVDLPAGSIIINTTSVGMSPRIEDSVLPTALFRAEHVFVDLVYNPRQTRFLALASARGAKTVDGLGMLIHQGVAAMALWSGRKIAIAADYAAIVALLQARLG